MPIINSKQPDFISSLLVCSVCKSDLEDLDSSLKCNQCGEEFPIENGIVQFVRLTAGELDASDPVEHRQEYERRFKSAADANRYRENFQGRRRTVNRNIREQKLLNDLLDDLPDCETVLDVPCGGGRLGPPLARRTQHLIEADSAFHQVKLAVANSDHDVERFGLTVSAMELPLGDLSVDGTLCARLSHHFPDPIEREALLKEVLRVTKKFVIFSYTDRWSTQTFFRKIVGRRVNPATMRPKEIAQICEKHGGRLEKIETVFALGSRHRFALITKI